VLRLRVLGSSGSPSPAAAVALQDQFADGRIVAGATTDADGRAEIRLAQSALHFVAHAAARGEAAVAGNLSVVHGVPVDVELRLEPTVSIRGIVRFEDGSPVEGVEVAAEFVVRRWTFVARAKTTAEGRFEIGGVPRSQFERTTNLTVPRTPGRCWGGRTNVTLADADAGEVEIVATASSRLRGRCVDELGQPVPGANVHFFVATSNAEGSSAEDGRFEFEVPRGAGHVLIRADSTLLRRIDDVRASEVELDLGTIALVREPPK
jgi:hypothetical protein